MADVVRNGAIFRVKDPSTMRSPMPRLPVARSRIASATPETPAVKRGGAGRVRSALERVVPRAPASPLPPPQQRQQRQQPSVDRQQQQQLPKRRLKKTNKNGVTSRKVQPSKADDANVLANFNRLVSESETRQAAKRAESNSGGGSGAKMPKDVVTTTSASEEGGEEEQTVEEREASSDETHGEKEERPPRAKGRKRPRAEPEEEPTEEEEDEQEGEEEEVEEEADAEEEEDVSSEEMVTPQPRRRTDASSSDNDDTGDDDDGVTVQKRLMYDDTPPAKAKIPPSKKKTKPATTLVQRKTKPTAKTSEEKKPVAAGGLEFMSMSSAATPSRSTRIRTGVLMMSEWYVDWPPSFVGDQLQLVVHGQVLGQSSTFTVQRRVTDVQFVSTDNQNVRLNGCLDIERAQQADVPPVVMELLVEGIPTNWRQLLEAYAPPPDPWMPLSVKSKDKAKQKNARAAAALAAAAAERQTSVPIPGVTKPTPKSSKKLSKASASKFAASDPRTPAVEKRSRSGRRLTPVMEWWRNERKVVDANFETKIVEGSPAYLPSKRETAMSDAAKAARLKIQEIYDAQRKSTEWSDAQLTALHEAKANVPTTHATFWVEVAKRVPGKSADECRARSFDDLPDVPARKGAGGGARAARGGAATTAAEQQAASQVPVKIHRAGSNLFKKQVRYFVRDQEQKNVDDLFSLSTPSKAAIAGGDFDLTSPDAPMVESRTQHDGGGDDSDEDGGAGRELLEKVSLSKRDDVDSYVRNLKRGNESLGLKAVRTSNAPGLTTPPAKKKPRRGGVHMTTEVGTHLLEGIVTPGGTTRVRVERGSDDEDMGVEGDEEEDEEAALSDAF